MVANYQAYNSPALGPVLWDRSVCEDAGSYFNRGEESLDCAVLHMLAVRCS